MRKWIESTYTFLGCFGALMFFLAVRASSQTTQIQSGKLTYVTSATAYVDLGMNNGFDVGDTLRVTKNGSTLVVLVVTNVASKSMATRIVSKNGLIKDGDAVAGAARHTAERRQAQVKSDTTTSHVPAITETKSAVSSSGQTPLSDGTQIHGRVSLQYYALASSTTSGFEFTQPAVVFSLNADNIFDMPLQFSLYSNHRYDARTQDKRIGVTPDRLANRVYQFTLQYGKTDGPLGVSVGRFISPVVGGVGTFDGVMIASRTGNWEAGVVGGTQPGYKNSEVSFADPKFAMYVSYAAGDYQTTRYQGSVAYAQTYKSSALDRGFMYMQNVLSLGSDISFYQNANFDLYDLEKNTTTTSFHLSDLFVSTTYRPLRWLTASGSYAIRRNVYFLHSFGFIPDSLFDKSNYQNIQLSFGMNLPMAMFFSLSGSTRLKEGDSRGANALSIRYTWANFFDLQTNMYLTGSVADNVFSKSTSYGLEFNRDIIQDIYAGFKAQKYNYTFSGGNRTLDRTTFSADIYYRISKMFYASLSLERYWEAAITSDRLYMDCTMRF